MFGVCALVRLTLAVVAFLYADSVPSVPFAMLCALPASGFFLLSVGVWTRDVGVETGGCPIWWKSLRPFHGLLWFMAALAFLFLYSKRRRHTVAALIALDALLGVVAWRWYRPVTRTCAMA